MTTDEERLAAWRAGDRDAGVSLISTHYNAIVRFFQTKAGPEADDLVQRTFLRCSEAIVRYQGTGTSRAFLFGIARNVLLEHIRRRVRDGRNVDFHARSIADLEPGVATQAAGRAESRAGTGAPADSGREQRHEVVAEVGPVLVAAAEVGAVDVVVCQVSAEAVLPLRLDRRCRGGVRRAPMVQSRTG